MMLADTSPADMRSVDMAADTRDVDMPAADTRDTVTDTNTIGTEARTDSSTGSRTGCSSRSTRCTAPDIRATIQSPDSGAAGTCNTVGRTESAPRERREALRTPAVRRTHAVRRELHHEVRLGRRPRRCRGRGLRHGAARTLARRR